MYSLEKRIAVDNFYRFCKLDGCDHIASEYALLTILRLCKRYKIESILEIGLGIGCVADTVKRYYEEIGKEIYYCGTEPNEFCLNELKKNVLNINDIKIYKSIIELNASKKFDLLIIDGGDNLLQTIKKNIKESAIIYIEGYRGSQVEAIKDTFSSVLHAEVISIKKNKAYSPFIKSHWMGGGQLLFINPPLIKKIHWLLEKSKTKLKYNLRFLKKLYL